MNKELSRVFLFIQSVTSNEINSLIKTFLMQTISGVCLVIMPLMLSYIVKEMILQDPITGLNWTFIIQLSLIFLAFAVIDIFFTRGVARGKILIAPKIRDNSASFLFSYLSKHSHKYIVNSTSGMLSNSILAGSNAITEGIWIFISEIWPAVVIVFTAVLILSFVSIPLALGILIWSIFFFYIAIRFTNERRPIGKKLSKARTKLAGEISDLLSNFITTKIFSRESYEQNRLNVSLDTEDKANFSYAVEAEKARVVFYFFAAIFKVFSLPLAAILLLDSENGIIYFMLVAFLGNTIINHLSVAANRLLYLYSQFTLLDESIRLILKPHDIMSTLEKSNQPIFSGDIIFSDVSFSYDGVNNIFSKLSVSITKGEKVALVGASGGGKTSFINLLLRLYDVDSGNIFIDETNIKNIPLNSLYANISLIPQDPSLFNRSIKENISYGDLSANDDAIFKAAKRADCDNFISRLEHRYDTNVGEKGIKLSGGQSQRISIARAFLKAAPIVVLDEATSALDSLTENTIQKTIDKEMTECTLLVIAHRLSTIKNMDRILVFENGSIVEDGSHASLISMKGVYFKMWSKQEEGAKGPISASNSVEGLNSEH